MTKEEFYLKMLSLKLLEDAGEISIEDVHIEADILMCDLLEALGYSDGADEFRKIPKRYS